MSDLDLDIAFNINESEVDADTKKTKERIKSVGDEARAQMKVVSTNVRGMGNSINQIFRELPAAAVSFQTFLLGASNNWPALADDMKRIAAANKELAAAGQKTVPVWKQLVQGILSWNTFMSVAITLATVYGKQLGELFMTIFRGKQAFNALAEAQKVNSQIQNEAIKNYAKEVAHLTTLKGVLTDKTLSEKRRNEALEEYNKIADASNKLDKTALDNSVLLEAAINRQILLIKERGMAKASENVIAEKAEKLFKAELDFNEKYPQYGNEADKQQDELARRAIVNAGDRLNIKGYNVEQLLAQSLLPDAALEEMAKQDKRFEILLDASTKSVLKSVNERKRQLAAIRGNQNGGYEGVKQGLQGIADAKAALEVATQAGMKYIKQQSAEKPTDTSKQDATTFAQMVTSRKGVLDKLVELDAEYARKSFTKDEEEKQALKDKFTAFRKIITDENAKIAEYNKTHKKQLGLIDVSQVDPIEKRAGEDLEYRQATDKLKISLDEQKKLYTAYEDYKTSFGEAKANERYKNELDTSKTYLQQLTEEQTKLTDQQAKGPLTGVQQERLKLVGDAIKDEQKLNADNIAKLLADLQSFEDKRAVIKANGEAKVNALVKAGEMQAAENQRKKTNAELTEFDKRKVEQLESYQDLFNNIDRMSTSALRKGIASLKSEVNKLQLTPKAKEFFDKLFGQLEHRAGSSDANDFKYMASGLNEAAQHAGTLSEGLGKAFGTAANLADKVGNIKQGMADFKLAKGDGNVFGQIGAGLGIFGSVLGIFTGLGSLFDRSAEIEKEREEGIRRQVELIESVNKRMREQIELNKELLGDKRIKGYAQSMADIAVKLDEQNKKLREQYMLSDNDTVNKALQKDMWWFGAGDDIKQKLRDAASLAKLSEARIKDLYDQGWLDDRAKAAYDSLIDLRKQQKDLLAEMNKEFTGIDFGGLLDNFASIFDKEKPTIEDFGKFFEDTMHAHMQAAFKRNVLEESLKDWYNAFAEASKDGLTQTEKDTLQADYNRRVAEIQAKAKELEQATGIKLANPDKDTNSKNSLSGAFKSASQESIDLLSAHMGGLRLAAVEGNTLHKMTNLTLSQTLEEIKKHTLHLTEIRDYSKTIAENSKYLKHLESMDRKMDDNKNYAAGTGRPTG